VKKYIYLIVLLFVFILGMITQKYFSLGIVVRFFYPKFGVSIIKDIIKKNHQRKLSIFILAGQSNMSGYGEVNEYKAINTFHKIYAFDDSYEWVIGKEPLLITGIGPSISFASQLLNRNYYQQIGLVNVSVGGTGIQDWQKNNSENSLYQKMLQRALAASTQGQIKGILFFQGEHDSGNGPNLHCYDWDVYFKKFVKDIRKELNNDSLPIIFAQLGKGTDKKWNVIKKLQESINIHNVKMIKTDDLPFQEGDVHFTTNGYIEIGKRFADTYINNFEK
jgi:hypothetical protein